MVGIDMEPIVGKHIETLDIGEEELEELLDPEGNSEFDMED